MNKIKNALIATLLLNALLYAGQAPETDDIIIGTISPDTSEENTSPQEQSIPIEKTSPSAIAQWNAHLGSLKEKDNEWNKNNNTPTNSWKDEAISLAKEALTQDKTIADTLKSAFFNAITEKIKLEEGEFTASTYALIKEFDDAIDAHATTLNKPEEETEIKIEEEVKPEPVVEQAPITIEITPALPVEEAPVPPVPAAAPVTQKTALEEWNDILQQITTMGNSETENKNLLIKTYELAKELLSQGYTGESLYDGFTYAIFQHNAHTNLFPIKISQAIEAFGEETGITISQDQQTQAAQQEYDAAMKKLAEQQKQKNAELKTAATVQEAIKRSNKSESEMERLNKKLEERLTLEAAARIAQQKETDAKIAALKQELASAHKPKTKEIPEEQGIISKAIGAVKGAASVASSWWYGGESQEQKDIAMLDQTRLQKLQEILKTMSLTPHEKLAIENSWKIFIEQLRSFKKLDMNDATKINEWLTTVKQALEHLTVTHNIISIADAMSIIKDAIKQYPDYATLINDIKAYLTEKQQKIIAAKQQQEDAEIKKLKERGQRKALVQSKQQKIKDEQERIRNEQMISKSYEREKREWQQFLAQITQNKHATEQENNVYTNEAIKKASSLLNPTKPVIVQNKLLLEQHLKQEFTNALLLQQKGNETTINIYKNIDQFNNALDKIT